MNNILERHPRLVRWLSAGIVVLVLLSFAKDFVIKTSVEIIGSKVIGAKLEMRGLALGIISHRIHITDLRIHNPPGFPKEVFLTMPEVTVDVDLAQAMKAKWHFPLVVINLKEFIVVRNKEKKLNVDELKVVQEQIKAMKEKKDQPQKLPDFTIDVLKLNIGKVIVKDESQGPVPVIQVYDLGLKDKTIRNIDGVPKLVTSILVEGLKPTAIKRAGVWAATTLMGVGFLPAAAFGVVIADDDASAELKVADKKVYEESLKLIKELGTLKSEDVSKRQILAKVYGCDIIVNIQRTGRGKSKVSIKARKYLLAKAEIASGLLYQLMERLDVGN